MGRARILDPVRIFEVAELYAAGATLRQLAPQFGANESTLMRALHRHGAPMRRRGSRAAALTPMQRWCSRVRFPGGAVGCWEWTGNPRGRYGAFWTGAKVVLAHRFGYEAFVGPVPEEAQLDHFACDNSRCVNPAHLRPATARENTLRAESITSASLAKTHCVAGHRLSGDNLLPDANGWRRCRACANEKHRRYRARKAAA